MIMKKIFDPNTYDYQPYATCFLLSLLLLSLHFLLQNDAPQKKHNKKHTKTTFNNNDNDTCNFYHDDSISIHFICLFDTIHQ